MSWRLIKSETLILTRVKALELAEKFKAMPKSPVERDIRPKNVAHLIGILRNNQALPFNWATVDYESLKVRMNGQNSSEAITQVGLEIPESLTFHLDHYKADTRSDMIDLF